jgi:hypothetical protein
VADNHVDNLRIAADMHGCGYMQATAKLVQSRSLGVGGGDLHRRLADAQLCRDEWVF